MSPFSYPKEDRSVFCPSVPLGLRYSHPLLHLPFIKSSTRCLPAYCGILYPVGLPDSSSVSIDVSGPLLSLLSLL